MIISTIADHKIIYSIHKALTLMLSSSLLISLLKPDRNDWLSKQNTTTNAKHSNVTVL